MQIKTEDMKTNKIRIAITTIAVLLSFQMAKAQLVGWIDSTISGSKGAIYRCSKNPKNNQAIYVNTNYDWDEILKEYPPNEYLDQTFPGYKINIHNSFLAAVRACFSEKRIKALADRDEHLDVGFSIDQDGNILYISFILGTTTTITPDELYCLEGNLKKLLVFKPIRKLNVKHMDGFGIMTNFKEIQVGEIPDIRRQEKEQQEKAQREARQHHRN